MSGIRLAGTALRELRIHLCQKSEASKGVRDFLNKEYVPLKKSNTDFPILVRECSGILPKVWARYEFGVERVVELENQSADQVKSVISELAATR
ncbi:unnamed protein product [Bursaphelenchus okinawaensis]|uniref:NADH dehydrogenase [ubiquinone] 1 alpha subcomplex subunit 2 n=1 Tax=Bursaphelenchus okinawaensis TaxID=465554 RepID=A0A811KBA2_9BILA|nr:unnamed protein product [Bursaphelenchus okinawaensis]CAG9096422.1 unnamed protein product [Bursaphelenchus okinawaensis]